MIKISSIQREEKQHQNNFCPFELLRILLMQCRGYISNEEKFFVFKDRSPVRPSHFCNTLNKPLNWRILIIHYIRDMDYACVDQWT